MMIKEINILILEAKLKDESKEIYRDGGLRQNIFRQILQKYKSIIGVLDEKSNNISS